MRDAQVSFAWADGDYTFRLGWGELELLQEACDAGPYAILNRLHDETWRIRDISHVIRLGLIGGGMVPTAALKKVRDYVEARVPNENLLFAQIILSAGIVGAPEEKLGEGDAPNPGGSNSTTSPMEN
ncbi:gene transfer agent family protein [Pararhizobium gei]|uniref:gene transfer agent family protein n=1 Tax=Pararhizobium gei TaxID=1395951 RepID=UPI0023DA6B47|nr:gene transfer agent family protein [Rhizobium gei]